MSVTGKATAIFQDVSRLENLGRTNIALPDGLYISPSEPALSSAWPIKQHDFSPARGSIRAALHSFLERWVSSRRPRR